MSNEDPGNIDPTDDPDAGLTTVQPTTDDPKKTAGGDRSRPPDNGEATWAPGQRGSDDAFWTDGSAESTAVPDAEKTLPPGADPDATYHPAETTAVGDIWGDTVDGATADQTLKGPQTQVPLAGSSDTDTSTPDLSEKGYDILDVLGEGGVGIVYRAVQKSVNRSVAVKMIKQGIGQDAKEKEKFISEAVVTGGLDHPNIVPIHDLDTTPEGQPFYTMKMVKGIPWGDVIQDKSLAENLDIFLDVCDAVSFAHSRNVVHRDLKPDNVMLGEFGEVQLMDWGLGAYVSADGGLVDLRGSQAAGGTPAFMAPEMVTGEDGPVGIHSDIYLLGGILYQIVAGKPPHAGKRVLDALENARNNVITQVDHPNVLTDIAMKAMQTEPADRHTSANDLRQALLDYQLHAESINLCNRATDDLQRAAETEDYETFAKALFGFREALEGWDGNTKARTAIVETQLQYARCALEKGDLDLAASMLDGDNATHRNLLAEVEHAERKRKTAKRRLRLFRVAVVTLTATVIVILTVASIWIYAAKQQAEDAREEAVASEAVAVGAQEAEAEQRRVAETAMTKAQDEEARAVKALADLEQAYADLIEAQEQEKQAWAQARASELVASETRDELAKTGMLLDNSWWVFDDKAARKGQEDAAVNIGLPAEFTIALADDVDLVMVLIPPRDFVMGSPPTEENRAADEHLHRVHHSRPFYMGKFELTETQWQALTGKPLDSIKDRDVDPTLPVSGVSFEHVTQEVLPALQEHAPKGYEFRLPSEAEWEYACRAGVSTAYHSGDDEDALALAGWYLSNSERKLQPVGSKLPNAFGLYDMHGNVSEVCVDQYVPGFYLESPTDDPIAEAEGETPVVRGGGILNTAAHCRAAYRSYVYRKNEYPFLGLRLALTPTRKTTPSKASDTLNEESNSPSEP